jgi:hypothetical protein
LVVALGVPVGCLLHASSGAPDSAIGLAGPPLSVTLAIPTTVRADFRAEAGVRDKARYIEEMPTIPQGTELKTERIYFDVVVMNVSEADVGIPRSSYLKLRVVDAQDKEHILEPHSVAPSMARAFDAYSLKPGACLVVRVYLDEYGFREASTPQVATFQAIYFCPEVMRSLTLRKPREGVSEERVLLDGFSRRHAYGVPSPFMP